METTAKTAVTIETSIQSPVSKVWECWNQPQHITRWCQASDDWHAPFAENDLRENGKFTTTMAAKDGSVSFDFGGVYTKVIENKLIEYTMDDDRKVKIEFSSDGNTTHVKETFDTENSNPVEMQRSGWQAILDNFKKYTEAQ